MNNERFSEAQKKMFANAVSVRIYPIALEDDEMEDWEWDAEITIPNNQWENSDEDGNFVIRMEGIYSFHSLEEAFTWAYRWLISRGYDVSNTEIEMNRILKLSDLAEVHKCWEM